MANLLRNAEGLRLSLLFLITPYAVLWTQAAHSGGWVMVVVHALLVLFYFLRVDAVMLAAGMDPRLSLSSDRFSAVGAPVAVWRFIVADLLIVFILVLAVLQTMLALYAAVAAAAILFAVRRADGREDRSRFALAELTIPFSLLIVPMILVGLRRWAEAVEGVEGARGVVMPMSAVGATLLGALVLGAWVAMSQIRDEPKDRGESMRTTPTVFGRGGAVGLLMLLLASAGVLSALGVGAGWWHWGVAATTSAGAMLAAQLIGARQEQSALRLWMWAGALTALLAAFTAPPVPAAAAAAPVSDEARAGLVNDAAREVDGAGKTP